MRRFCLDHLSLADLDALALIDAAATAGFAAVSLFATPVPISGAADLVDDSGARKKVLAALRATELGVGIVEPFMLEPDMDWPLLEGLAELTAQMQGTANILGMDDEPQRMQDSLQRLVDICRKAGAPAIIEAFPLSAISTPAIALELVQELGNDIGLCIDTLHVIRGGGSWADVAALPPERIRHVQFNDGMLQTPADRWREAVLDRLLPGEGEFDLAALLPHLPAHATIAVEAPSLSLASLPASERSERLHKSMQRLFATS